MKIDYLAKKNEHERDKYIEFDEGPHIYTVHGELGYTSVTTWNHHHFPVFDSDKIIDNMMKGKKWNDKEKNAKYKVSSKIYKNLFWLPSSLNLNEK